MDIFNYRVNLPYPEVAGEVCSACLGSLQDAYSGRFSEATAVFQYSYQSYILKEKYPALAELLEGVAIVEMAHHEMLAKAIIAFGGDPIIAGKYSFFSGSYVNYVKNPCGILQQNIVGEKQAIVDYQKLITVCDNMSVKQLISRIIMDEELHITLFEKELSSFCNI